MPGFARLLLVLAGSCTVNLWLWPAHAAAPEWNAVRSHDVAIGPEAGRLLIGFRATAGNSVVKTVPGRAQAQSVRIVQASSSSSDVAALTQRTGLALAKSRQITPSMHVLYLPKTLYGADVNAVLKKLRADPSVLFAAVDQRRYPHAYPDDPLFVPTTGASGQWFMQTPSSTILTLAPGVTTEDLSATDAVSAWTITEGSTSTVIADIDTGVRFDHPDLLRAGFGGRMLPGYDFVDQDYSPTTSMPLGTFLIANDGDGYDPDPSDPGDWINTTDQMNTVLFPVKNCPAMDSSWHGTRVMGVLGALTDNGVGIAGTTRYPYLLPVRALGKCGGYDSDIIAGMEWAAGMSSVMDGAGNTIPDNPYPADIINLSLGSTGTCDASTGYPSVIATLTTMGVLVVASAGNENGPVDVPGNCAGVLAVAGLRNEGNKVGYSSFGSEVGISAPAGNCVTNGGPCYRSIDTTYNTGLTTPVANAYTDETNSNLGTSFSAPIVSGIAALMRAVNANLTPGQLITRIKASASPFPANNSVPPLPVCPNTDPNSQECSCVTTQCGAGMVNAKSAVTAALKPISVITSSSSTTFDASGSVAACGYTVASYLWTPSAAVTISGSNMAAQVTVIVAGAGKVTLTVTDNASHADTSATVSFSSAGGAPTINAPSSAGTAASACPTPLTFTPAAPTVSEAFSPTSVGENVASTLTITFSNTNGYALTQAGFTETVPAGLKVMTSPAPTTTCNGGAGTLTSSASAVTMAGANIPASGNCTLTLSVESATAGTYTNSTPAKALSTGPAGSNAAAASASLTVTAPVAGHSGGGEVDWFDMMFVAGVLLVSRRQAGRRAQR